MQRSHTETLYITAGGSNRPRAASRLSEEEFPTTTRPPLGHSPAGSTISLHPHHQYQPQQPSSGLLSASASSLGLSGSEVHGPAGGKIDEDEASGDEQEEVTRPGAPARLMSYEQGPFESLEAARGDGRQRSERAKEASPWHGYSLY